MGNGIFYLREWLIFYGKFLGGKIYHTRHRFPRIRHGKFLPTHEALELIAQLRFYYMYHLTSKEHLVANIRKIVGEKVVNEKKQRYFF